MSDSKGRGAPAGRSGVRQLVGFRVGPGRFAVDIAQVQEIVKPPPVTVVPGAPAGFTGVIRLRDEVISVADLHQRFDLEAAGDVDERHIIVLAGAGLRTGILVDAVSEVIRVTPTMLAPSPAFHGGVPVACIESMARVGADLVCVLDVDALFAHDDAPTPVESAREAAPEPRPEVAPPPTPAPAPTPAFDAVADKAEDGRLYREIGELARYINTAHRTLAAEAAAAPTTVAFPRPNDLPSANDVLQSVTQETEIATMQVLANTEESSGTIAHLIAMLGDLEQSVPAASEGRAQTCDLAERMRVELGHLEAVQNDTLMALSFQDLTGQKIRQVIALMAEVEERILEIVVEYGMEGAGRVAEAAEQRLKDVKGEAGPGRLRQDRVDGLLAEFGF